MKQILFLGIALLALTAVNAQNGTIYAPAGKAINGYDVVAFFTKHTPVMGTDSLFYDWKGARWLFANRNDLNAFEADPNRYAPQYGGYCAYGVSQGHKAPTKAETWTIVSDKLYFNYNNTVKASWIKDQQTLIRQADQQWPGLETKN